MDSLPVPVCDNIRIRRCRLYPCRHRAGHKASRGAGRAQKCGAKGRGTKRTSCSGADCASKRRYFTETISA